MRTTAFVVGVALASQAFAQASFLWGDITSRYSVSFGTGTELNTAVLAVDRDAWIQQTLGTAPQGFIYGAPWNAVNQRVSAAGNIAVSNIQLVSGPAPDIGSISFTATFSGSGSARSGVMSVGFDTSPVTVGPAQPSGNAVLGTSGGFETLTLLFRDRLVPDTGFADTAPGSEFDGTLAIEGNWMAGHNGTGGASVWSSNPGFTLTDNFVYDPVLDRTRVRFHKVYEPTTDQNLNTLLWSVTLIGNPVPSPNVLAGIAVMSAIVSRRRRR